MLRKLVSVQTFLIILSLCFVAESSARKCGATYEAVNELNMTVTLELKSFYSPTQGIALPSDIHVWNKESPESKFFSETRKITVDPETNETVSFITGCDGSLWLKFWVKETNQRGQVDGNSGRGTIRIK